jgi:ABC-type nitrate/sulfonate/bicarbonate transport system permease component
VSAAAARASRLHPPEFPRGRFITRVVNPGSIAILAGIAFWEIAARAWHQPFFPPFSTVLDRLWQLFLDDKIVPNLRNSLLNLVIGFSISVVAGVGIGMLMGAYKKVEMALDAYVYALLTAPSLVFAPIFFAIFGIGDRRIILGIIILYSIFIIIVNTSAAIHSVPVSLIEMGRSYCASERQLFTKIILPAALPFIFAGIRLGMGRAVKGMINGEMFISAVGLGAIVSAAGDRFDAATVLAVLLVIITVALLAVKLVQVIDARTTSWLPSTAREGRARRR